MAGALRFLVWLQREGRVCGCRVREKKMGNGVEAEWGSGCFGREFCFLGRERRLEQIRAKEKIKKTKGGGTVGGCGGSGSGL